MINKDRVFIISSNVDDSIRGASIYSEVTIFKTFNEFEEYIDKNPVDVYQIIVNSKDLRFTNNSMNRLINVITSTFVNLEGFLYYLVDDEETQDKVTTLCKRNGLNKIKCVYRPTLHARDVADVLSGEALQSKETVTLIHTYRMRASDYEKYKRDKEGLDYSDDYESDEDELSGIPDEEEPEDLRVTDPIKAVRHNVCSNNIIERCSWVLLKAQYLSLSGKTLIVERDKEYHTLFDMISKIGIDYQFFDIVDFFKDCSDFLSQIRSSTSSLIFIGSKSRVEYNYDIIMNILVSNLEEDIDHYVYEFELNQIPYGETVDIILPTTVPEILKSVNLMTNISDYENIYFIGLDITNLGIVSISDKELNSLLSELLQENNIKSIAVKINGLILRKEIGLGGVFMHD